MYCEKRDEGSNGEPVGPVHIRQNAMTALRRREAAAQETMRRAGIEARTSTKAKQSTPIDLARAHRRRPARVRLGSCTAKMTDGGSTLIVYFCEASNRNHLL